MTYSEHSQEQGWVLTETFAQESGLGRVESLFHLANGYMGVRAATEEARMGEMRGMYVAGTFDRFSALDVTELPNVPDMLNMELRLNGHRVTPEAMNINGYVLRLDMRTGLLVREFSHTAQDGAKLTLRFSRIVSMARRHILAQKLELICDKDAQLSFRSGINGRVTNSGVQHFVSGLKMLLPEDVIRSDYMTNQSNIAFCLLCGHRWNIDGKPLSLGGRVEIDARSVSMQYDLSISAGQRVSVEKISGVYTSRDKEQLGRDFMQDADDVILAHADSLHLGFDALQRESASAWKAIWDQLDIQVQTDDPFDQISLRYAIFQLAMMTPEHDNRMNIGAKGLSGEAYKGHTFWDTEIFLLPMWAAEQPQVARSLLGYRYHCLDGARRKAKENGYEGAMYPWESAWITDGEVTPKWGAADVVTGKPLPIICGDIEQHITGDVAYGCWYYEQMTGDLEFMRNGGYEIIFETAGFWQSRWTWDESRRQYVIHDVIGPDEYSEHVNNNAFTNILSWWNVKLALTYYHRLEMEEPELLASLKAKLPLEHYVTEWREKVDKVYLPKPNTHGVLPQDDTYLTLAEIPLEKYKNSPTRADIIKDYNMEQISGLQVSKQADVVVLMNLGIMPFTKEEQQANYCYYERHCLHDSSLSLAMYSLAASRLGESQQALQFFKKAQRVDLNNSDAAKEGIHAASMGGLWQCVVHGFAGLRPERGALRVEPCLPQGWRSISFSLLWMGVQLNVTVTQDQAIIRATEAPLDLKLLHGQKEYPLTPETVIAL